AVAAASVETTSLPGIRNWPQTCAWPSRTAKIKTILARKRGDISRFFFISSSRSGHPTNNRHQPCVPFPKESYFHDLAAGRGVAEGDFNPLKSSQKLRTNSKIAMGESNQ